MSGPASHAAEIVASTPPTAAFYLALVLYGVAALFYVSAFTAAPRWMPPASRWTLIAAFVVHGVEIGWRGVEGVHPGYSVREAIGFLPWVLVGGYLWWSRRLGLAMLGAFLAPIALALLAAARLTPSTSGGAPFSALGRVHISLATLGVALFALATAVAVMYLLEERNLKRKRFDRVLFKRGVALDSLDGLSHRLVVLGFPVFTASLTLGVVWGARLRGGFARPEWSLAVVTWAAFAALLVARTTVGWRGRRAAKLTIIGFAACVAVLTFYFVRSTVAG